MDSYPVTARSLGRTYYVDGDNLERNYKNHLSDFRTWPEQNHTEDWNLLVENMGTHLSIDETSIDHVVYVFLTNKDGHGKKMPRSARNMPRSIRRLTRARNVGASLYVLMPDTYLQRCPTETLQ